MSEYNGFGVGGSGGGVRGGGMEEVRTTDQNKKKITTKSGR